MSNIAERGLNPLTPPPLNTALAHIAAKPEGCIPACLLSWILRHRTCRHPGCVCEQRLYTSHQDLARRPLCRQQPVPRCEVGSIDDFEPPPAPSCLLPHRPMSVSPQQPASATRREILHTKKNIEMHSLNSVLWPNNFYMPPYDIFAR